MWNLYIYFVITCIATKIPFMYSQKKKLLGLRPNFHIHVSVLYADRSWEYIHRSQTHECGNGDWGRTIPFLGIFVWIFGITSLQCDPKGRRRKDTNLLLLLETLERQCQPNPLVSDMTISCFFCTLTSTISNGKGSDVSRSLIRISIAKKIFMSH